MQAEQYEVEEILEERTYARGSNVVTEYRVKWKGYPHEEATWEPIQNLDNCQEAVKRYQEKKMAKKVPKHQKTNSKDKPVPQLKTHMNPIPQEKPAKDIMTTNRNDFYFSDESNLNEEKRMDVQLHQDRPRSSFEVGEKIEEQAERRAVKGRRGRVKKDRQEEHPQNSKSLKGLVKMEPSKRVEPITHRILQKVLFQQIPVRRPIRSDQFTLRHKSNQTSVQARSELGVKVVSMHISIEFPGKIWFTVEQEGKFIEVSQQKLIMSDSKALYYFYHKHYLQAKTKRDIMHAQMMNIIQQQISGKTREESDSDEDFSVLDYFSIAKQYHTQDGESRSKFQRLIRSVTVKPKTDKCLI